MTDNHSSLRGKAKKIIKNLKNEMSMKKLDRHTLIKRSIDQSDILSKREQKYFMGGYGDEDVGNCYSCQVALIDCTVIYATCCGNSDAVCGELMYQIFADVSNVYCH